MGRAKIQHPQRYYQYALLDAVDLPFVIFKYHLRTMGEFSLPFPPSQVLFVWYDVGRRC